MELSTTSMSWSTLSDERVVWKDVGEFEGIVKFVLLNECYVYFVFVDEILKFCLIVLNAIYIEL